MPAVTPAAAAVLVAVVVSGAAAAVPHEPPTIPEYWSTTGVQYISSADTPPPFADNAGVPAPPYSAGRMESFYDWSHRAMVEHYLDACVPIFPEAAPTDPGFECSFVNVNETSFLVTYNSSRPSWAVPCCVFGKPWHPPSPDFLRNLTMEELPAESPINGSEARWYKVAVPPPAGPFFYAWNVPFVPAAETQNYAAFDFPGIASWVSQNFKTVSRERPPASKWTLPETECGTDPTRLPACPASYAAHRSPWYALAH